MRSKVLIVTSRDDAHTDALIDYANSNGYSQRVVRLNTEDLLINTTVEFDTTTCFVKIHDSGRAFSSDEIQSVWFRRPREITTAHLDPRADAFAKLQGTACLRGLYFCTHDTALWVNPLPALHRARNKMQQLQAAQRAGLSVPPTVVTNNPGAALAFAQEHQLICMKSLDEPNYELDGVIHPLLTRIVTVEEIASNLEALSALPTLLQQFINKRSDVRVVAYGRDLVGFEIHSQEHELSRTDFRGIAPKFLRHTVHDLPLEIRTRIQRFLAHQGLVFSALDFIISESGEYIFLENNPNGQWLWLEGLTGFPLTAGMAKLLFGQQ